MLLLLKAQLLRRWTRNRQPLPPQQVETRRAQMAKCRQRRLLLRLATLLLSQLPRARRIKRSLPLRVLRRQDHRRGTWASGLLMTRVSMRILLSSTVAMAKPQLTCVVLGIFRAAL